MQLKYTDIFIGALLVHPKEYTCPLRIFQEQQIQQESDMVHAFSIGIVMLCRSSWEILSPVKRVLSPIRHFNHEEFSTAAGGPRSFCKLIKIVKQPQMVFLPLEHNTLQSSMTAHGTYL